MTQVTSYEAQFKAEGANKVVDGFKQIAQAAKAAQQQQREDAKIAKQVAREKMQATKTLLAYNKQVAREQAQIEKQQQRDAKQALREQQQNHRNMIQGFKTAAIAAAAVGVAIKKTYDIAKEGAQLEFTRSKFDRLTESIGTTSDTLLNKMQKATRGTISEFGAMGLASDVLGLGLVNNERDVVRLATVMSGLGMDLGEVTLAIANQSTKRFDQLNVSLIGFDEKLKAAKQSGLDADSAFTEAFLQQAEQQLLKVGNAADSTAGQFMIFEANAANAWNSVKIGAANAIAPVLEFMNAQAELTKQTISVEDVWDSYARALGMTGTELEELRGVNIDGASAYSMFSDEVKRATQYGTAWEKALAGQITPATEEQKEKVVDLQGEMEYLSSIIKGDLTSAQEDYREKVAELNKELETTYSAQGKSDILAQIQAETDAYNERANAIIFNIQQQAIMAAVEAGQIDAGDALSAITELASSYGMIDEEQKKVIDSTNQMVDRFSQSGDMETFVSGLQGLAMNARDAGDNTKATADATAALNEKLEAVGMSLENLPPSGSVWSYSLNFTTSGIAQGAAEDFDPIDKKAKGGQLKGWTLVGEEGPELITPTGYVIPSPQTRNMLANGLGAQHERAVGGMMDEGFTQSAGVEAYSQIYRQNLTPAVDTNISSVAQPIITGVTQQQAQAQSAMVTATKLATSESRRTNTLLAALLSKTPTAGNIGREVAVAGVTYK